MNGRTRTILGRLPAHFVATRSREDGEPAKLLEATVAALSRDLDELATDLARTRRAHRIGHADTLIDVLRLAGLHGMDRAVFLPLWRRIEEIRARAHALAGAPSAQREAAAERLLGLWGLDVDELLAEDRTLLSLWAAPAGDGTFDVAASAARLALHAAESVRHQARLELARTRVTELAAIHAIGNGTVDALLTAAATALDLAIDFPHNRRIKDQLIRDGAPSIHPDLVSDPFLHSRDRYWHVSFARDRFRLGRPVLAPPAAGAPPEAVDPRPLAQRDAELILLDEPYDKLTIRELALQLSTRVDVVILEAAALDPPIALTPTSVIPAAAVARIGEAFGRATVQLLPTARELIGIEENPLRRETAAPVRAPHAHRFKIRRRGFGAARLRVRVKGIGDLTRGPMVVNRDAGHGVGYVGPVADGDVLEFTEEGRVNINGSGVTSYAYSWHGACFADAADLRKGHDFYFAASPGATDRRRARFAVIEPIGALDRDPIYPTAGVGISVPPIGVGETRMAYFVRASHFGGFDPTPPPGAAVTTTPWIWNGAFDETVFDAPPGSRPDAGEVTLSWLEHEAHAVRIVIPLRFATLDEGAAADQTVPAMVRAAVERVRPVGIDVRVEYLDERWSLGEGRLPDADIDDPLVRITGGTLLWPTPEPA